MICNLCQPLNDIRIPGGFLDLIHLRHNRLNLRATLLNIHVLFNIVSIFSIASTLTPWTYKTNSHHTTTAKYQT